MRYFLDLPKDSIAYQIWPLNHSQMHERGYKLSVREIRFNLDKRKSLLEE